MDLYIPSRDDFPNLTEALLTTPACSAPYVPGPGVSFPAYELRSALLGVIDTPLLPKVGLAL